VTAFSALDRALIPRGLQPSEVCEGEHELPPSDDDPGARVGQGECVEPTPCASDSQR
jgi:hypothetical protein